MRKGQYIVTAIIALFLLTAVTAATAEIKAVVRTTANVYEKPTIFSSVLATAQKGQTVNVVAAKGAWAAIAHSGKTGFMLKRQLVKKDGANNKPKNNVSVLQIQQRLTEKGYLKSAQATGKTNAASSKALRIFQMMNSLSVNGDANQATIARLFSGSARSMPAISIEPWKSCGVGNHFRRRGLALIIDMATGLRIRIRRVGGTEHLDVEPQTAADTAALKKAYNGTFSWDSRGVLLIAGGKCYAGAINSMPHGKQISHTNNYDGQFCLHLRDCQTHGTEKENPAHQTNIEKVYRYLTA